MFFRIFSFLFSVVKIASYGLHFYFIVTVLFFPSDINLRSQYSRPVTFIIFILIICEYVYVQMYVQPSSMIQADLICSFKLSPLFKFT